MTIEQLIQKANAAHANSEFELALSYLKEAGNLGDSNAALDYAYKTAPEAPQSAVDYLATIPTSHRPIVQYHQLLIGYFGGVYKSERYVTERLINLAREQVIEAYLVLLAYLPIRTKEFTYVAHQLKSQSPNIYSQLNLSNFVERNVTVISDDKLIKVLLPRFNVSNIECNVVDDALPLTVYDNVLSAFECNYIVKRFSPMLEPSMIVDPITGKGRVDSVRTSQVAIIFPEVADWITRKIDLIVAHLTDTKVTQGEALTLLRYEDGQEYKPHYDAFSVGEDAVIFQDGGQRVKTALIYLNTLEEGGATYFPKLNKRVAPVLGSMLVFPNVDSNGDTLINSYHAGEKITTTNKWLVTKWIRKNNTNYGNLIFGEKANRLLNDKGKHG